MSERKRRLPLAAALALVIVTAVCAAGAAGFAVWAYAVHGDADQTHTVALHDRDQHDKQLAAERARQLEEQARAEQEKKAQAAVAAQFKKQGFEASVDDPTVFWKNLDGTCSYGMDCAWVGAVSTKDCPGGIYLAASLESHGAVVAHGNDITGGVAALQLATAELDFPGASNASGNYTLTSAHCL